MVDRGYCMSSYLMYRYVFDNSKSFQQSKQCRIADIDFSMKPVKNAGELLNRIKEYMKVMNMDGKCALALSGGIDSAILAKFMPKGSTAYTFRCKVIGKKVTDESEQAAKWADICGLKHKVIDIYWEDIESVCNKLMEHKGMPIHSIETQIYLAACRAKKEGYTKLIFGENADIIYGGMDGLLAEDWHFADFVDRYSYIMPYRVLKNPQMILDPFWEFERDGYIDGYKFINKFFRQEALGTYTNACETAGIEFVGPYSRTYLNGVIDYTRIRTGDTKYIVREAFRYLYPQEKMPEKIPMPRPMNEWFEGWGGPTRIEFIPHCTDKMTGDQKWMVWALERYLDLLGEE